MERRGETNAFLLELIEEEADAAEAVGDRIAALDRPPEAEWPDWSRTVQAAWHALKDDRFRGAMGGMAGIYYTAISAYAHDHGIVGDSFRLFVRFVTALDAEYVAFEHDRLKAERDKNNGGSR